MAGATFAHHFIGEKFMRILLLTFNTVGKGTYWRALYLAREMSKLGHQVTLMATARQSRLKIATKQDQESAVTLVETPDLLWGPGRSGWDVWNSVRRMGWANGRTFDIVHGFECRPTVLYPALHWQRRGAVLLFDWCDWFGRGGSVEERPSPLARTILRPIESHFEENYRTRANATTVINSVLRQKALELGVPAETILPLPNGCNVDELFPVSMIEARRRLGLTKDTPIIGYIGAIFQQDAVLMARSFDHVHAALPQARLLVAGYCNVDIRRLAQNPEAVWQTGPVPYEQINDYLAAANLWWLPLVNSGANRGRSPLKMNDYMAAGKAIVATDVGDVGSFVRDAGLGLAASDTPADLAQKALALLNDPARCQQMGQVARQIAETTLSWKTIAGSLANFYMQTLEKVTTND